MGEIGKGRAKSFGQKNPDLDAINGSGSNLALQQGKPRMKISHLVVAIIAAGMFTCRGEAQLLDAWFFNEASGTVASDSIGSYNGTLVNGASFVSGGIEGNALSLNAADNQYLTLGPSFPGFTSGNFSIVAWVKTSASSSAPIFTKHDAGHGNGYFLGLNYIGDGSTASVVGGATFYTSSTPGNSVYSPALSLNDNGWHQIVGVYTPGQSEIYVDGNLVGVNDSPNSIVGNTSAAIIGGIGQTAGNGTPYGAFTGLVDDVQVYGNALSSSDVTFLYNNPTSAVPEPSTDALILAGTAFAGTVFWRRRGKQFIG